MAEYFSALISYYIFEPVYMICDISNHKPPSHNTRYKNQIKLGVKNCSQFLQHLTVLHTQSGGIRAEKSNWNLLENCQ
jgi:hypothetical protein